MEMRFKTYETEIKADGDTRSMHFLISTGGVDRDNDVLDPTGWKLDAFRANPIVMFAHDYKSLPVAKCTNIQQTAKGLEATAEFPAKGVYGFADTVHDMLKGGFLNATSVGFQPIDYEQATDRKGFNFKTQELTEFSIVPIPANREALVQMRQAGMADEKIQTWRKAITEWASALEGGEATKAQLRFTTLMDAAKPKSGLIPWKGNATAWAALEKDYVIESEQADLSQGRLAKLLAIHGFTEESAILSKEPASADSQQAKAMAKARGHVMDAYANAHHAATVMSDLCNMSDQMPGADAKALSGGHMTRAKEAQGAIGRAKDHAMAAAETMSTFTASPMAAADGGKDYAGLSKPMPTPNDGEGEKDFISRCAGSKVMNSDYPDDKQRVAVCYAQWRQHERRLAGHTPLTKEEQQILDDREIVLTILDAKDDHQGITDQDVRDVLKDLTPALSAMAADTAKQAVNRMLGRID